MKFKWIDEESVTGNPDKISDLYKFSWNLDSGYSLVDELRFTDAKPGDDEAVAARVAKPEEHGPPADIGEALNEEFSYQDQLSQQMARQDIKVKETTFSLPHQ